MKFNGSGLVMGTYEVALRCPDCEEVTMVGVELTTVLTHASDESATLKLRAKTSKVLHSCGIEQPQLFDSDGRIHAVEDVNGP